MKTETSEILLYGDKPMSLEPVNMSLKVVAWQLCMGNPVVAKLEPGDGTHYALLIVPAWADGVSEHLGRYGIRPVAACEYLTVTHLHDQYGHMFYSHCLGTESYDMPSIKNEWTQTVFTWWLRALWLQITNNRKA